MRIAVCIKQVPDNSARLRPSRDGRWVDEDDLPFTMNESDEYALEEGLALAERTSGSVAAFSLGPDRAREVLRKALAIGASRAVHLRDHAFDGGDAVATGRALAAAVAREPFDLVLTGSDSSDLAFGGTGSILAGELGWPHVSLVTRIEIEEGGRALRASREIERGRLEVVRLPLPAVLQVQTGINHPRYASLKGIMAAKKKEILELTPEDLGLFPGEVGAGGSRIETTAVVPSEHRPVEMIEGDAGTAAAALLDRLRDVLVRDPSMPRPTSRSPRG